MQRCGRPAAPSSPTTRTPSWGPPRRAFFRYNYLGMGCAVFATFFIRFEANLSEHGPYSLYIRMFRYISKHRLFASFASYSLQNIRINSHTIIRFDSKQIHVEANIRFRANTRFTFSHTGKYSLQNIHLEENIRKTSSEFHIQVNICFKIFAYKRIFAGKYSHQAKILYVLLQII